MADVIQFDPRPRASGKAPSAEPAPRKARARVSTSFQLVLRALPAQAHPDEVARQMLASGSNAAAAPIWRGAEALFRRTISGMRLRPADLIDLRAKYRAAVRASGIARKAARRNGEAGAFRVFDELA